MENHETDIAATLRREPWNKGKLIGQKPPLRPKHVWSIRTKLQFLFCTRCRSNQFRQPYGKRRRGLASLSRLRVPRPTAG